MASSNRSVRAVLPVVISGGSGTRLWPLSRDARPKQFLPLIGATSLYQQTLERVRNLSVGVRPPIIVCNAAHRDFVLTQSQELGIDLGAVVIEPIGRNTAPAVAVAALLAAQSVEGEDPLLLVLPADHVIADDRAFAAAVHVAVEAAERGWLTTFGVVPSRPETGYGYILRGALHGGWAEIGKFVEKPDQKTAEAYVASGDYSWNSGMFLFSAAQWLQELRAHAPAMLAACERVVDAARREGVTVQLGDEFALCPADSIDYAVMEKTSHGAVVPLAAGWSDVGSWSSLVEMLPRNAQGNTTSGDVMLESCRNTYVHADKRFVAAVGLDDIVIVETDDAVLVLRRDCAQDIKKIVSALRAKQRSET